MRHALIHRVRVLAVADAASRDAEGSMQDTAAPTAGPWIRARVMERGGPASRRREEGSTAGRVSRGYEVLLDLVDELGDPVSIPAGARLETECEPLGNPLIDLDGQPSVLNNGRRVIGLQAFGARPGESA